jgi:hypothetical protein
MDIHQIHQKLQTDWADWNDADNDRPCLSICKHELMQAMQVINAYLVSYDLKTRIENDPSPKICEFCSQTYRGAAPVCLECLLKMKVKIRRLSCLLNEEDLRKVLTGEDSARSVM